MANVALKAAKRSLMGKALKDLRAKGLVPGVMYGQGKEALALEADVKELTRVYHEAGTSKLVNVEMGEDKPQSVLFYDVQTDAVSQKILHFDLYTVKMDEKIHTEVPLHFIGDAPAVITHNAELVKNVESVEIEALPKDLPENIEVDISVLENFGDSITIADLKIPEGVEIDVDPEVMVIKAEEQRETSEEDFEEIAEDAEAQVESEHGGEESAEGEEPAEGDGKTKAAPSVEGDKKPAETAKKE